jgi:hypothetical protein
LSSTLVHVAGSRRRLASTAAVAVVLALTWFVPLDFITLSTRDKAVILLASLLLAGVGAVSSGRSARALGTFRWISFFAALQALALIMGYPSLGYVALVMFVFGGYLVGRALVSSFKLAVAAAALGWMIAVEQWASHSYGYVTSFGTPLLPITVGGGFRSRGTLGEPLAVMAVFASLLLAAAVAAWSDRQRPRWHGAACIAMIVVLAIATGSRTGLFVPVAALVVSATIAHHNRAMRSLRWLTGGALYGVAVVVVCGLLLLPGLLGSLGTDTRALAFSGISQTQSYTVRSGAAGAIVGDIEAGSLTQLIFGRGDRALQRYLQNTNILNGFDTGDDQYLTLSYDFGLIGLVALVLCWVVALRALRSARTPEELAAATGLVCWLIFAAFLDDLYLFSGDVVLGLLLGWTLGRPRGPQVVTRSAATSGPVVAGSRLFDG